MRHPVTDAQERLAPAVQVVQLKNSFVDRCRAMLSRSGTQRKAPAKAPTTYRKKSEELGIAFNNALVQSCGRSLGDWALPEDLARRGDPDEWPILHLAQEPHRKLAVWSRSRAGVSLRSKPCVSGVCSCPGQGLSRRVLCWWTPLGSPKP